MADRKGHASSSGEEEAEYCELTPNAKQPRKENDPYEKLEPCTEDDQELEWRYNKETNEYHLPNWFTLSEKLYKSLFPH